LRNLNLSFVIAFVTVKIVLQRTSTVNVMFTSYRLLLFSVLQHVPVFEMSAVSTLKTQCAVGNT